MAIPIGQKIINIDVSKKGVVIYTENGTLNVIAAEDGLTVEVSE